jgi:menaquinol-cytochrome c reductase iron-sulfur subunit
MNRQVNRRRFLSAGILGLTGLAGAVVSVPIVAYLLDPLLHPAPNEWRDVGAVGQFKVGETVEVTFQDPSPLPWAGQTAKTAAWLRRDGVEQFTAFAVNCTHLGCPVSWLQSAGLFLCPCHGGVYYANGSVAAGPPPHALFHYDTRVRSGRVEVLTRGLQVG